MGKFGREELERRLRGRGTDSDASIDRRLRDAVSDMSHWNEFDYALINETVEAAAGQFEAILDGRGEEHRVDSQVLQARVGSILTTTD